MYKAVCFAYDKDGRGIVKLDNKVGFVKNLLVGEECILTKITGKKKFFEAEIDHKANTLTKQSKERVSQTYNGTCNLSHLSFLEQLKFQQEITQNSFERSGLVFPKIDKCIFSEVETNYRNKAVLIANHELNYTRLGYHFEKSNRFCLQDKNILYPTALNNLIFKLNDELKECKIILKEVAKVIFRTNLENDFQVTFILKNNNLETVHELSNLNSLLAPNISIHYTLNGKIHIVKGSQFITQKIGDIVYLLNGLAFFQTNSFMVGKFYREILSKISCENCVIDAFSGISTIGQYIAKTAKKVYSIEINKDANNCARKCIELNKITNLEILEGDFTFQFSKVKNKADTIILDPPKAGVEKYVLIELNQSNLEKIIYLSCNLPSLVRDLKILDNFKITKIQPFKNFPQTAECETLVVLSRK